MTLEERIITAAEKLFARRGFHGTGMRAIARSAKVSIGAIYHYFSSKEEVFLAILRREFERRREAIELLRRKDLPIGEMIRHMARLHFSMLQEQAGTVRLLSESWLAGGSKLRQKVQALYQEFAAYIADLIQEGVQSGSIRPCHPMIAAYALLGMVEAVTARALTGDEQAQEFMSHGPEELANFAWQALRAEGAQ